VVALDLRSHEAVVEHSDGRSHRIALAPDRSVGAVARELLEAVNALAGPVVINPTPQEVSWSVPLDADEQHASYSPVQVAAYFAAATRAALVLGEFRAPYRGRSTPVNAWWGSFDLAVSLFSGQPAQPPSQDFIMRNAMDAQEVAVGWFADMALSPPAARWEAALGEYVLDWDDLAASADPHATALAFVRSAFNHACAVCKWDPALAASAEGTPPPVV
jgi:hypothetical protein